MTTYVLSGFVMDDSGPGTPQTGTSQARIITRDGDDTARWSPAGSNGDGLNFAEFDLDPHALFINGVRIEDYPALDSYVVRIDWSGGTSYAMAFENTATGRTHVFFLGGAAVTSLAQFQTALQGNVTTAPAGSGFGPGEPILLPEIAALSSTTEADVFPGTPQGDDYDLGAGNDSVIGLGGDDTLNGGAGDDTLRGGDGRDRLRGGGGNDLLDASNGDTASQNFGDVVQPGLGRDTVLGHAGLYAQGEGIDLIYDDVSGVGGLTIDVGADGSGTAVSGQPGRVNDTFTYANFFIGSGDSDRMLGSATEWEGWVGGAGDDTINGRAGYDTVFHFDDPGAIAVTISGTGLGTVKDGFGGTDTLRNIEEVRGTGFDDSMRIEGVTGIRFRGEGGNDTLIGAGGDDQLEGEGGNDLINGRYGDDELQGGAGSDTLRGGDGNDYLGGGDGDDLLDASGGSAASQGFGDYVQPGFGRDTILGHRALFEADENTDLSYSDLSGFGGIVVTSGANGSGTVKSRTGTSVDDTFSYIGYFVGSQDDDILNGADGDFWEGWDGAAGNDTINGGGGYDMLSYRWNGDTAITAIVTAAGAGTAVDGFGDTDTFTGIERIQGSRFGDLMRNDSAAGFEFQGDLGNDTIQGGSGDGDVLRLRVNRADAQVAVQGGAVIVTSAEGTDRLTGVETLRFDDGDQDISYLLADIVGTGAGEALTGTDAPEDIRGLEGNDRIEGRGGDDTLVGGDGDDSLLGEAGNDLLRGGAGRDWAYAEAGDDTIDGGDGFDRIDYRGSAAAVTVDLAAGTATDGLGGTDTLISVERVIGSDFDDTIQGDGGNNSFTGSGGDDRIDGRGGRDFVWYGDATAAVVVDLAAGSATGGEGSDTLIGIEEVAGSSFSDTLRGSTDDDLFVPDWEASDMVNAAGGADLVDGRGGFDIVAYWTALAGVQVDLAAGTATDGLGNTDTLISIEGAEGSEFGDTIQGDAGANRIDGMGGDDTLAGGDGNDAVWGGDGRDRVFLGAGDDAFFDTGQGGEAGRDTVFGAGGNDTVQGGNGDDAFYGGAGNDLVIGRLGNDRIHGGTGFDILAGGAGDDSVWGGDGRDKVFLGGGSDTFFDTAQGGEAGRDTVFGGGGGDTIQGGNGDDAFYGGAGDDLVIGRLGDDTIYGGTGADTLNGGAGDDRVFGGDGPDRAFLGGGDDLFADTAQGGELGRDTVFGGTGNDTIQGGGGDDVFYGGAGNDVIVGRMGNDRLTGGAGADRFVFAPGLETDIVTDFDLSADRLVFDDALWAAGQTALDFASVQNGSVVFAFDDGSRVVLLELDATAGLGGAIEVI